MKKLTKQNLDELAETMNIIPADEQREYMGQYSNDCFWRCVAYLCGDGTSEAIAEVYAQSYYNRMYGEAAAVQTLERFGSGMIFSDARDYVNSSSDSQHLKGKILWVNPDLIGHYSSNGYGSINGTGHYIVYEGRGSGTDHNVFDPQAGEHFTISGSELGGAYGM